MAHDNRPRLPDIFPDNEREEIRVEREKYRYEVFQGENNSQLPKYEYTLQKSPVIEVEKVVGQTGGEQRTFSEGSDYVLSDFQDEQRDTFTFTSNRLEYTLSSVPDFNTVVIEDDDGNTFENNVDFAIVESNSNSRFSTIDWSVGGAQPADQTRFVAKYNVTFENSNIDWDQGGDKPDAGTNFYVTYRTTPLMSRYLESADEELSEVEENLDKIIESKFINTAQGDELDKIGDTFGPLGNRRGREDSRYRIYLKSLVQSFTSRGTKNGIKRALSAATDVPLGDIVINEDFENNQYEVQILAATPLTGSLLEQVAEIADPSGVELALTRFTIRNQEVQFDDSVSFGDTASAGTDSMGSDDSTSINPNKTDAGTDNISSEDSIRSVNETRVAWNTSNWGEMNWAIEHN